MSTEIQKAKPQVAIVGGRMMASDIEGVWRIAQAMFESGLMPNGVKSPAAAFVMCNAANELGIGFTEAITGIGVINGRPVLHSRLPMSLALRTGQFGGMDVEWTGKGDTTGCKVTVKRNTPGGVLEFVGEFSMDDAKRAGLLGKDVWKSYPKDMLLARAKSRALGNGFADALGGMGIAQPDDEDKIFARRVVVNEAGPAAATGDAIDALGDENDPGAPPEGAEVTGATELSVRPATRRGPGGVESVVISQEDLAF